MKKPSVFLGYFDYSVKRFLTYRIYLIGELLSSLVLPIVLSFFLWKSVIGSNSVGYNLSEMMRYIIVSNVILLFTQIHVENDLEKDIKTYRLGQKLLLPVKYFTGIVYQYICTSIVKFITIYLPIIAVTSILFGIKVKTFHVMYFVLMLVLGFMLNALFSFAIGLLAFWLTEIWGVAAIRNLMTSLLSGAVFPLDILPKKIESVMLMTPFPYMAYVPSKLICDPNINMNMVHNGIYVSILWVLCLCAISFALYKNGLKKYTSNGE